MAENKIRVRSHCFSPLSDGSVHQSTACTSVAAPAGSYSLFSSSSSSLSLLLFPPLFFPYIPFLHIYLHPLFILLPLLSFPHHSFLLPFPCCSSSSYSPQFFYFSSSFASSPSISSFFTRPLIPDLYFGSVLHFLSLFFLGVFVYPHIVANSCNL